MLFWNSSKRWRYWLQSQHPNFIRWEMVNIWKWRNRVCVVIPDFLTKHPLTLHFLMLTISQWMELGSWDWTQCIRLFKLFQNCTHFAKFGVTGDSFWLTHVFLSNYRFFNQTPSTPPFSTIHHFSKDGARIMRLDSMTSSFKADLESHLFCSIWCNRRLVLTYICNGHCGWLWVDHRY